MKRFLVTLTILSAACVGTAMLNAYAAEKQSRKAPMIVHNVYFSLKDNSDTERQSLVADSHRLLAPIPGITFYAAGTLAEMRRDVNDREFDVALHVVFPDTEALEKYLVHPKHLEYVQKNKANWDRVRVFDSRVDGAGS